MKMFQESFKEFKDLRAVVVTGLLIALSMVIESFTINLGFAKINFAFLAIAAIGMLYGPSVSLFAGAVCDVLGILSKKEETLPDDIAAMVRERAEARKNRDWAKSDELRDKIVKAGYILEDTKQGQKVRKNV